METILVVEDQPILRESIRETLEAVGYAVVAAEHGQDALEKMQDHVPSLILSDITMPVMDGWAFLNRLRAHPEWALIPFIFLTARGSHEEVLAGKGLGVEDYLIKPVNVDELVGMVRARLVRTQQVRLAQLRQSYEASLAVLANAIEIRDSYTRGHVERVMTYALAIARRIDQNDAFLESIRFGAILHDIGKIHVREEVLRKTGPLDEDEWAEIRYHPTTGAEMIADIEYLLPAVPGIRHHHERWDGRGYPDGLAGNDIPLAARIIAVADAYDAMTSNRTYRQALSREQALKRIIAGAGSKYDPQVVNAFQAAWHMDGIGNELSTS